MAPKMPPRGPQNYKNAAPTRDLILGEIPRSIFAILGGQKEAQKTANIAQNPASAPQGRPEASREPFRSHFGLILGPGNLENHVKYEVPAPGGHYNNVKYEVSARGSFENT